MKKLESKAQFDQAKQENSVFLFSANWCPDCRFLDPFMPEMEQTFSEFNFYYVDRDEHLEIAQEMNIFGIPSFVAYRENEETGRYVGKERKTPEQVTAFLETV
ncbi:thioredoxin family protein [Exiguobacterium antarcticum]|uniref:Thioredoxin family protein n=1 Tax=Exiguobacterium antarcticum TaxID=132920 RepID=A0ABT6QZF1_9BACL|nr:thioredoxin family protein [Exiguobacterium antarcticum]MDI3233414.1 thioredoxin family protein [Exiguobacterium antarcticum]